MKRLLLPIAALLVIAFGVPGTGLASQKGGACKGARGDAPRVTAYISPKSSRQFRSLARYRRADGCPAISFAILFAANYAADEPPYLRANNNTPPTTKPFNDNIQQVLDDGSVRYLQRRGIKVMLSIDNGHSAVGWSQFTSRREALDFVRYLKRDVVARYGLDGIDIDDEYSNGVANRTSLIMVSTLMRQLMPNKIITKALFEDKKYFRASWKGHRLAENLDYGWEMAYGGAPRPRVAPYTRWLSKKQLSLGFWSGSPSRTPIEDVQWLRDQGYAGLMAYGFEDRSGVKLMGDLVHAWDGPGSWRKAGPGSPRRR
jgi:Glycosyl hydrolases family 18